MKRRGLEKRLRLAGCILKREGSSHSLYNACHRASRTPPYDQARYFADDRLLSRYLPAGISATAKRFEKSCATPISSRICETWPRWWV